MTLAGEKGAPSSAGVPPVPPVAEVPPAGEEIHLPGPTLIPFVTAIGISLALVGIVIHVLIAVAGVIVTLLAVVRWVRETRRDIDELPLEH